MGQENNFPNVEEFTVAGESASSWLFTPERELSLRQVSMPGKSVTSTVAEPIALGFAMSEAVTRLELAAIGGVNRPDGVIVPGEQLPTGTHATDQLTSLLLTPGVSTFNCSVCDVVTLEIFGESLSGPWIELND